jgi:formate/nitrite transporter FocA (FNT family)
VTLVITFIFFYSLCPHLAHIVMDKQSDLKVLSQKKSDLKVDKTFMFTFLQSFVCAFFTAVIKS